MKLSVISVNGMLGIELRPVEVWLIDPSIVRSAGAGMTADSLGRVERAREHERPLEQAGRKRR